MVAQTICAITALYQVQTSFRIPIDRIGMPNSPSLGSVIQFILTALIGQALHWQHQRTVSVPSTYKNIVIGHFLASASKIESSRAGTVLDLPYTA
ncbi:hypothetical protein [Bosea psychrotolerans]|uniref:hypothetical protein n=1 Tax=Bosea psychrotolerans TaxID=1871628 RepID=UPI0011AFD319|nr:hypothetical protein [Bosea psychrotolerans]